MYVHAYENAPIYKFDHVGGTISLYSMSGSLHMCLHLMLVTIPWKVTILLDMSKAWGLDNFESCG